MKPSDVQEQGPLPLLPRISMVWFFIVAAVVAVALLIIRSLDEERALPGAIIYSALFVAVFFVMGSFFFFIAYFVGATEKVISTPTSTTSPFSDAGLPPQLIPPRSTDEQF